MKAIYSIEQGIEHEEQNKSNLESNEKIKKQENQSPNYENQESHHISSLLKQQLNTANDILPAHKKFKENKEKLSFKLNSTYLGQSSLQKINKNIFQSLNHNSKSQISKLKNNEQNNEISLKQQMGEFGQYLNEFKVLIYQRIKNQRLNYLSKNEKIKQKSKNKNQTKYFCSLFLNPKINKNQSKHKPIFEHLQKLYEIQQPYVIPDTLQFSSHFESGNLFAVFKDYNEVIPTYELFLQNDTNTKGSTQWFNFKVVNKLRMKAKFKIINFYKENSLYEQGMKVLASIDGQQWKRIGTAIKYGKSSNQALKSKSFSLQFIYEFEGVNKSTNFAYGYPYNLTLKLIPFLDHIFRVNYSRKYINKSVLCRTNMGNEVSLIIISNNILNKKVQKPIIYVIGRQHPGETPSSYVMEGFLNFLLSNRIQAQYLRQYFEFRIIPMVNIDGVVSGNYRTNISGNDVNRQWLFPSKTLHPQIYYLKQQIISNKKNTIFFLDIHAHSRKMNSFFYGCKQANNQNKLYPFVCSKLNKFISYNDSSFGQDASKQTTGRVVIQKELNLINSLTFQISFFGWIDPVKKTKIHFTIRDLEQIGMSLALGIYYTEISIKQLKSINFQMAQSKNDKQRKLYQNSIKIFQKWKSQLQKQKKQDDVLSDGSSIDPEQFQLKKQEQENIQTQNNVFMKSLGEIKTQRFNSKIIKSNQNNFDSTLTELTLTQGKKSGRYFKSLKKQKAIHQSIDLDENQEENSKGKSNLFGYSGNQFFLMSSRQLMVKRLESQLQENKQKIMNSERYRSIDEKLMNNKNEMEIDFKSTIKYHEKLNQMKKTFNYCLNNNKQFDSYRSYYKSATSKNPNPSPNLYSQKIDSHNLSLNLGITRSIFPKRHLRITSHTTHTTNTNFKNSYEQQKRIIKLQKI